MSDPQSDTSLLESHQALMPNQVLKITGRSNPLELKKCSISENVPGPDGKRLPVVVPNKEFYHYTFEDFGAREVEFNNCDFSYSVFTRAYFYRAKFNNCKFIGVRFTDCNFRSARFIGCDFSYAAFRGTIIPSKEIRSNVPPRPNVRRELMQALRVNALSVGDDDDVKTYIWEEMRAAEEHNRKAREAQEPYYNKKYGWSNNKWKWLAVRLERPWLWIQRFGWGYGERPLRLLRSIGILLSLFTILVCTESSHSVVEFVSNIIPSVKYTISVFLGTPFATQHPLPTVGLILVSWIALSRYVTLSLFAAMLFRRLSRR